MQGSIPAAPVIWGSASSTCWLDVSHHEACGPPGSFKSSKNFIQSLSPLKIFSPLKFPHSEEPNNTQTHKNNRAEFAALTLCCFLFKEENDLFFIV